VIDLRIGDSIYFTFYLHSLKGLCYCACGSPNSWSVNFISCR